MKKLVLVPLFAAAMMVVGCQSQKPQTPAATIPPATPARPVVTPADLPPAPSGPMMADPLPAGPVVDPGPASAPRASAPKAAPVHKAAAAPKAAAGKKYTVKKGDTLSSIAKATYGKASSYKKIVAANPGLDPNKIRVGQVITLP